MVHCPGGRKQTGQVSWQKLGLIPGMWLTVGVEEICLGDQGPYLNERDLTLRLLLSWVLVLADTFDA